MSSLDLHLAAEIRAARRALDRAGIETLALAAAATAAAIAAGALLATLADLAASALAR